MFIHSLDVDITFSSSSLSLKCRNIFPSAAFAPVKGLTLAPSLTPSATSFTYRVMMSESILSLRKNPDCPERACMTISHQQPEIS